MIPEYPEMSDKELMDMAESWILAEVRRCRRKLALSETDLVSVVLRVVSKITVDYYRDRLKEHEAKSES